MEEASVMMVGLELNRIYQAISVLSNFNYDEGQLMNQVTDYKALNVSEKVLRIIHSYSDYVERVVWRNY